MTPLERLIARPVAERATFTVGAATEKIAESIANEMLSDEEFRRSFKEMVDTYSRALFKRLMREKTRRVRRRRARKRATR